MFRKSHLIATICAAALSTAMLTGPAQAADAVKSAEPAKHQTQNQTQNAAEKKMDEIVESSDQVQDGAVQPSTGRAEPIENWFGCKPDTDSDDVTECGPEKSENQQKPADAITTN